MPRVRMSLLLGLCGSITAVSNAGAGSPTTVVLKTAAAEYRGTPLAHDQQRCWLVEANGELHDIRVPDILEFEGTGQAFRPESIVAARDRLQRRTPRGMEVAALGRYVVLGPTGQAAVYARLLEDVYAEYWSFFSRRQVVLKQPEFPLIVYVFPTYDQFAAYARDEGAPVSPQLKGYYHRRTNRIALFVEGSELNPRSTPSRPTSSTPSSVRSLIDSTVEGDLRTTLIHEATHQLAYNTGLHSRVGDGPRWVSEGLAMLFEEDSRRDDSGARDPSERVHRSRYVWYMNYRQNRRPRQALADFLCTEDAFESAPLDAYSEAWALSFYLIETRRADYAKYLQKVAARNPLLPYTPEDRLADFQSCFGRDVAYFEGQYGLWIERLKVQ